MDTANLKNNNMEDLKELYAKLVELKRFKLAQRVQKVINEKEKNNA